jgi:hypothetical protein
MAYAGLINAVVFLFQKIGFNPILNEGLYRGEEGGIMGNAPRLASYLTLIFPFVPLWLKGVFLAIALIVKEFALVGLAWLMALAFCIKNIKKREIIYEVGFVGLIIFAISGISRYHSDIYASLHLRWTIWKPAIEMIFKRPLLGYGFGIYPEIANQFTNIGQLVICAFSSILQFIFEVGLLGVVWIGFAIKYYKKYSGFNPATWGVVALLMLSILEYPFQIPKLYFTICAVLAFFIIQKEDTNESSVCRP